jgi:hypothetical protein
MQMESMRAISKSVEIVMYLLQANRDPKKVNNHKIIPPQHTAILKWIKNSILFEEVKEEINYKYKSLFQIEEIMGTKIGFISSQNSKIDLSFLFRCFLNNN